MSNGMGSWKKSTPEPVGPWQVFDEQYVRNMSTGDFSVVLDPMYHTERHFREDFFELQTPEREDDGLGPTDLQDQPRFDCDQRELERAVLGYIAEAVWGHELSSEGIDQWHVDIDLEASLTLWSDQQDAGVAGRYQPESHDAIVRCIQIKYETPVSGETWTTQEGQTWSRETVLLPVTSVGDWDFIENTDVGKYEHRPVGDFLQQGHHWYSHYKQQDRDLTMALLRTAQELRKDRALYADLLHPLVDTYVSEFYQPDDQPFWPEHVRRWYLLLRRQHDLTIQDIPETRRVLWNKRNLPTAHDLETFGE